MWLVQFSYADNMARQPKQLLLSSWDIQSVPGGKVYILGGHSISHSKQKCLYEHVSYSERFPR